MKIALSRLQAVLVVITLAWGSLAYAQTGPTETKTSVPSTKELKVLLKTANEPADHLRIAAYYRHEAERLTQSSKEHAELAAIYEKNPPFASMVAKHGDSFGQGAPHCKRFAELNAEAAKEATALAELHEGMAKAAEQKQP